jgi:glucose/arabinose dehydrogenase
MIPTRITLRAALPAFALFAGFAQSAPAATLPPGFTEFAITQAISNGTAMEFSPDGKLFVLEQSGTVEVYEGSGATAWTRLQENFFANVPISVDSFFERGMLGIAFDPDYLNPNNRFVYFYYTTSTAPIHNRIIRVTANATGDLAVAGSLTPIVELENLSAGNHNGGAIHFGPHDGMLYAAVGENANSSNSQNINNRLGKILRYDVDNPPNYIPSDNPTSIAGIMGTLSGANAAIWAAGLRNPFTFAFQPGTGLMYINDVGAGSWEEVNVGAAGANYGWNQTEGPFNQAGFPNFTHPIIAYQHSGGASNYPPGSPVYTGNVIAGGTFYFGDYFYADAGASFIKRYNPSSNTVSNWATGAGGPVDLKTGPDNSLYYLSRGAGRVFRITPTVPACTGNIVNTGTSVNRVDVDDLLAVISGWGPCASPPNCPANIINTGTSVNTVDVDDLLAVISLWGPCP